MELKIKVCGMKETGNIREISGLNPDYMGFIFYPGSKRYAGNISPAALKQLPDAIEKVAVFVNAPREEIIATCRAYSIRILQLHGDEPPAYCRSFMEVGFRVIKAFRVGRSLDAEGMDRYAESADMFLLDTSAEGFGGTGKKFNWLHLARYRSPVPFFLSGGIGPADAGRIMEMDIPQLHGVDLNSRFEIRPGVKNKNDLDTFIRNIRS
jgi:phosphoribosylanthranilate isomerase